MELKDKYQNFLFDTFSRVKVPGYSPNELRNQISRYGAVEASRRLINAPRVSEGYTKLSLACRLDLTIEALIYDNSQWHSLFTSEELEICKKRLNKFAYF